MKVYVIYIKSISGICCSEPLKVFSTKKSAEEYVELDESGGYEYIELEIEDE